MLCVVADGITYVSPEAIAKRWACSARHVRNLIHRGELTGICIGGPLRVRKDELEAFEHAARISPPTVRGARAAGLSPEPPIARMPELPVRLAGAASCKELDRPVNRSKSKGSFWDR